MIYLKLFLTFFEIGLFTFGGGYAMISLVREKALVHGWLTEAELLNMIAVSESTPGPIAVNMATFLGSTQAGVLGSICATLGVVLPSFLIILLISAFIRNFLKYKGVQVFLGGIRPCVVALILGTSVLMFLSILFGAATLIIIVGSLFWLFDSLEILTNYLNRFVNVSLWHKTTLTKGDIIISCFTGGLILFTFVNYFFSPSNYKLNTRLNFAFINWGFWLSLIWVVVFGAEFAQLIAIPGLFAVMCLSLYFSTNQSKVANVVFVVWVIVFVAYRFVF